MTPGEWYHRYAIFTTYRFLWACIGRKVVFSDDNLPHLDSYRILKTVEDCKVTQIKIKRYSNYKIGHTVKYLHRKRSKKNSGNAGKSEKKEVLRYRCARFNILGWFPNNSFIKEIYELLYFFSTKVHVYLWMPVAGCSINTHAPSRKRPVPLKRNSKSRHTFSPRGTKRRRYYFL